jgi:hypothetical protein
MDRSDMEEKDPLFWEALAKALAEEGQPLHKDELRDLILSPQGAGKVAIRELDPVALRRGKGEWGLEAGAVGTVVLVYPKGGYLVEFTGHDGEAVALLDLTEEEVEPLKGPRGSK